MCRCIGLLPSKFIFAIWFGRSDEMCRFERILVRNGEFSRFKSSDWWTIGWLLNSQKAKFLNYEFVCPHIIWQEWWNEKKGKKATGGNSWTFLMASLMKIRIGTQSCPILSESLGSWMSMKQAEYFGDWITPPCIMIGCRIFWRYFDLFDLKAVQPHCRAALKSMMVFLLDRQISRIALQMIDDTCENTMFWTVFESQRLYLVDFRPLTWKSHQFRSPTRAFKWIFSEADHHSEGSTDLHYCEKSGLSQRNTGFGRPLTRSEIMPLRNFSMLSLHSKPINESVWSEMT
jgi:hypothetical protein